MSLLIDN